MKYLVDHILIWYHENKRDLPWRKTRDPYPVWISEVMLQQTRIEAVISYYHRFMKELPTISALASVSSDRLLKLWEGLGYYSRARNLQKAAQIMMEQYHGQFPNTYEEIIKLPGIGNYTASAISSICFGEKKSVVDGNVLRVYARYFNDDSNVDDMKVRLRVQQELEQVMPDEAGDFNEGIMELGEVVCLPNGIPLCSQCPLKDRCLSHQKGTFLDLPVKKQKKEKKTYFYTILIFQYQDQIAIHQRQTEGLLHHLWEFPNVEGKLSQQQVLDYCHSLSVSVQKISKGISYTHVFTHQKWVMNSFIITLDHICDHLEYLFLPFQKIKSEYAIPTAFQPFFNQIKEKD